MDVKTLRKRLRSPATKLDEVNAFLVDPGNEAITAVLDVVAKYGTPEEINRQAKAARSLPNLLGRLKAMNSPYVADLEWLQAQREPACLREHGGLPASRCWGAGRGKVRV